MRFITNILLVLINFILQTTLLENFLILGIKPNLSIVLIVSIAFMRGELEGALVGAFNGFLFDAFFSNFLGLHIFIGFIVGYLFGVFFHGFYKNSFIIPLILNFLGVFLYEFIFYTLNILLKGYPNFIYFFKTIILPEMIYTSFISIFIYRILLFINTKLEKKEKFSRKIFRY